MSSLLPAVVRPPSVYFKYANKIAVPSVDEVHGYGHLGLVWEKVVGLAVAVLGLV